MIFLKLQSILRWNVENVHVRVTRVLIGDSVPKYTWHFANIIRLMPQIVHSYEDIKSNTYQWRTQNKIGSTHTSNSSQDIFMRDRNPMHIRHFVIDCDVGLSCNIDPEDIWRELLVNGPLKPCRYCRNWHIYEQCHAATFHTYAW